MSDTISAQVVADYFIALSNDTQNLVSNLKLQKLVYYVEAWYLAVYGEPLFKEDFEAWVHGPVVRALYEKYKGFSWKPIVQNTKENDSEKIFNQLPKEVQVILQDVVEEYFGLTAFELERLTHAEDPWKSAREGLGNQENSNTVISKDSMQEFYSNLLTTANGA